MAWFKFQFGLNLPEPMNVLPKVLKILVNTLTHKNSLENGQNKTMMLENTSLKS